MKKGFILAELLIVCFIIGIILDSSVGRAYTEIERIYLGFDWGIIR